MSDIQRGSKPRQTLSGMPGHGGKGAGHGRMVEKAKDAKGTLRRLLAYFKPFRFKLLLVFVLAGSGTLLALLSPYLIGKAVDHITDGSFSAVKELVMFLFAVHFFSMLAQMSQGVLMARITQKSMRLIRRDLFGHIQKLSLKFFDSSRQGDLMSRLTNDMDSISRILTTHVSELFTGLLSIFGILAIIFILNPWLALGSMIVFPFMLLLVGVVGRKTRDSFRQYQKNVGDLNGVLEETFSGQKVVLAFGQEKNVLTRFNQANKEVADTGEKAMTLALLVMPMMGILSNLNIAILGGLGGWLAIKGLVSIGTIAAFITYSRRFAEPLRQLGNLYNQIQGALAGAERIFELLDTEPDHADHPNARILENLKGEVTFKDLTFSYLPGTPVLKDINIKAKPGEKIALVGHTGAGKTTLVNLLSRFYEMDEGSIEIDGVDIRDISRDSLRKNLGIVLQHSFLFSESVMENIRYGRLNATDEEVIKAAELAYADEFIRKLPKGYQTRLSERGSNLSEGQRQLVTIARAILADPAILVLDEATSSVDTRTEVLIQHGLQELMKGKTSFVIAHRLSTISNADQLVVIDQGRVVESGNHIELLKKQGFYYRLYQSQFRGQAH